MKTIFFRPISWILILSLGLFLNCEKDYLDRPSNDQIDSENFFKTEQQLKSYVNGFYELFPGQSVYEDDAASDNIMRLIISERVRGTRTVPVNSESGGWYWRPLRRINYFLEHVHQVNDSDLINKYSAFAKFFRAYFYYHKVKQFGDVPWYDKVLNAGDEDLYKPRDSRYLVMENVLNDINQAIEFLPTEKKLNEITKYTALLLKARICLFEGTFRKYHGLDNYEFYLSEAASASNSLINSGAYTLYTNGDPKSSYRELFDLIDQNNTETILAKDYNSDYLTHNIGNLANSSTNGSFGAPKDFVNSFLMADGSRFTDLPNYNTIEYYNEMQQRDPRLTQIVGGPNFTAYLSNEPEIVNLEITTTGYRIIKAISSKDQWENNSSINDIILFRYAEALLIYAEAKAELNTLTQHDLDISINKLRTRVNMPALNLAQANTTSDPYLEAMYPNVTGNNKGVILEIRRERRIELYMEGHRWDDLMRWKAGKKLEHPFLGIYFSGLGGFDFDNNGTTDVYLHDGNSSNAPSGTPNIIDVTERKLTEGNMGNFKPFEEQFNFDESKDYYYPIPTEDLSLNPNLIQNPGW